MTLKNTTLDDIASVIGFSAALRLSAWFGDNNNLFVPQNPQPESELFKLIGESAAKRMSAEFGGSHLAIPRISDYELTVRKKMICRMLEQGFGTREVSTMVKLTERRVIQIARELEAGGFIEPIAPKKKPPRNPQENQQEKSPLEIEDEIL